MPLFASEPNIDRTEVINRAVKAEYAELKRQGYSDYDALSQACRTVIDQMDAQTRAIYWQEGGTPSGVSR